MLQWGSWWNTLLSVAVVLHFFWNALSKEVTFMCGLFLLLFIPSIGGGTHVWGTRSALPTVCCWSVWSPFSNGGHSIFVFALDGYFKYLTDLNAFPIIFHIVQKEHGFYCILKIIAVNYWNLITWDTFLRTKTWLLQKPQSSFALPVLRAQQILYSVWIINGDKLE